MLLLLTMVMASSKTPVDLFPDNLSDILEQPKPVWYFNIHGRDPSDTKVTVSDNSIRIEQQIESPYSAAQDEYSAFQLSQTTTAYNKADGEPQSVHASFRTYGLEGQKHYRLNYYLNEKYPSEVTYIDEQGKHHQVALEDCYDELGIVLPGYDVLTRANLTKTPLTNI